MNFQKLFHFLMPNLCIFCQSNTFQSLAICELCYTTLPFLSLSLKFADFTEIFALFSYETPITNFIAQLKYQRQLHLAKFFGQLLAIQLQEKNINLPEILLPVPLHWQRLRKRGFNQAIEIARPISRQFNIPMDVSSIQRIKPTKPQADLSYDERIKNTKNVFAIKKPFYAKAVAILDDVVTTGATISDLKRVLFSAGVRDVSVWCCARVFNTPSLNPPGSRDRHPVT